MATLRELAENDWGDIELELEPDDIVTDVIVITRVQKLDSTNDTLVIGSGENTGGIVCHGMLTASVVQHTEWMRGEDRE